jgi:hypothetical protein
MSADLDPLCMCRHLETKHEPDVGCLDCDCLTFRPWPVPAAILPYGNTSGHAPAPSSRDAVVARDKDGRTATQQERAYLAVQASGWGGLTWRELDRLYGWGHGTTSRVLSDLHKAGRLARLLETRARCAVYVHPDKVEGRETGTQGRVKRDPVSAVERSDLNWLMGYMDVAAPSPFRDRVLTALTVVERLAPGTITPVTQP